jgi:hypothetical protein
MATLGLWMSATQERTLNAANEQAVTVSIRLASNGETLAVLVPYLVLGIATLGVGALTLWRAT